MLATWQMQMQKGVAWMSLLAMEMVSTLVIRWRWLLPLTRRVRAMTMSKYLCSWPLYGVCIGVLCVYVYSHMYCGVYVCIEYVYMHVFIYMCVYALYVCMYSEYVIK
jgi:hypothetical protein